MSRINQFLVIASFLFLIPFPGRAQQAKVDPAKQHEQKVKDIIAFLEYVLNTLGSGSTSARDKDVLITESYTKIFRDGKVQVEDDLVDNRNVITNKDVQAYLKDVDFFFKDVKFELRIDKIEGKVMPDERLFYKVSLTRNLKGTNFEGKPVNTTIPRFIEINFEPKDQDLKIVSIYTREFDETGTLLNWWKGLSYEWQSIFKRRLNFLGDSIQLDDIRNITSIEKLDLSGNRYIRDIEPLTPLLNLRVLDLSNTDILDLTPIRNLTELADLNLANTKIDDISPLRYAEKLTSLNISRTSIMDINIIQKMPALERLELRATGIADISPFKNLTALKYLDIESARIFDLTPLSSLANLNTLNISKTPVTDVGPLSGLKNLKSLTLDSTQVSDISALRGLTNLQLLYMNYTQVSDLQPLQNCTKLERVYCDNTLVKRSQADAFMGSRPGVLVIVDSEDLRDWWNVLSVSWRNAFTDAAGIGPDPGKEELVRVTNLDSVNLSDKPAVRDFEPLRRLPKLQVIIANKTGIADLSPLKELREIRYLDISDTQINDLSDILHLTRLRVLRADRTQIETIDPLTSLTGLEKLYVDQTTIHDLLVQEFLEKNPDCLVIYKTKRLEKWWEEMPESWKGVLQTKVPVRETSRQENLHTLIESQTLHFKDIMVNDLSPLKEFIRLKELHFSGTAISDLSPLAELKSLRSLLATNSPLRSLSSIQVLTGLEDIDISNTPVSDLSPLSTLQNLKSLNCSGTPIKKLNPLSKLKGLESLDCSNTSVNKLDPVSRLSLRSLKCYNTRISKSRVEDFKEINPECTVVYYR